MNAAKLLLSQHVVFEPIFSGGKRWSSNGGLVPHLVVVMELNRMPLAITDPAWDVGRHLGLSLTWTTRKDKERKGER